MSDNQALARHIIKLPDAVQCLDVVPGTRQVYTISEKSIVFLDLPGSSGYKIDLSFIPSPRAAVIMSGAVFVSDGTSLWNVSSREKIFTGGNYISVIKSDEISGSIFIGQADGKVLSINAKTKEVTELYRHKGQVTDISIGNKFIISTALAKVDPVIYYETTSRKLRTLSSPVFSANAVDLTGDSVFAIAYENGYVAAYSLSGMQELWREQSDYSASEVKFSADGNLLASGTSAGKITVYDAHGSARDSWQAVSGGVWKIVWANDTVISGGSDGWVRAWVPRRFAIPGRQFRKVDHFYWNKDDLMGLDSNVVYNLSAGTRLHAIEDWRCSKLLDANRLNFYKGAGHTPLTFPASYDSLRVVSSIISANGDIVVSAWWPLQSHYGNLSGAVTIWNVAANTVVRLDSFPEFPKSIDILDDRQVVATGTDGICVWYLKDKNRAAKIRTRDLQPISKIRFLNDKQMVVGYLLGKLEIVDISNPLHPVYSSEIPTGNIYDLEILRDSTILMTDVDGLKWFDNHLNYLGPLVNTQGGRSMVSDPKESPKGKTIAVQRRSGEVNTLQLDVDQIAHAARISANAMFHIDSIKTKSFPRRCQ